jgi:RNA polymerase sigma factor (sigma-70 family)
VTVWLDRLKAGGHTNEAVNQLFERYFVLLVGSARQHLRNRTPKEDGEDVALAAFDRFVRATAAGRFPKLNDRDDLWRVLLMLTATKAANAVRDENRQKRGGRKVVSTSAADSDASGLPVPSPEPEPVEAVALAESAERLLNVLGNEELRQIAVLALEGHTTREIARRIGKAVATVERKRRLIRETWTKKGLG